MPRFAVALTTGSRVRSMEETRFNGTLKTEKVAGEDRGYLSNIAALDRQIQAEEGITLPLSAVFNVPGGDGVEFKGSIDAMYECEGGRFLLIDWKTDRVVNYAGDHRKQLSVYRRLYSRKHGIDESKIDVGRD